MVTFVAAFVLNFTLPRLMPGDPVAAIVARQAQGMSNATGVQAIYEQYTELFGTNLPIHEQFFLYVKNVLQGDFGYSFSQYPRTVADVIKAAKGGVDIIYCSENDTDQLVVAIRAAKDNCDLPVWAHNLFYPTRKGFRTMMGLDVKTASARLAEAGADVVGAGCGGISPIGDALAVVREMRQGCDRPLSIKPDAGLAQLVDNKIVQPVSPEEMAREVPKWIAAGASLVGGCCGTSLEHIGAISAAAKAAPKK